MINSNPLTFENIKGLRTGIKKSTC